MLAPFGQINDIIHEAGLSRAIPCYYKIKLPPFFANCRLIEVGSKNNLSNNHILCISNNAEESTFKFLAQRDNVFRQTFTHITFLVCWIHYIPQELNCSFSNYFYGYIFVTRGRCMRTMKNKIFFNQDVIYQDICFFNIFIDHISFNKPYFVLCHVSMPNLLSYILLFAFYSYLPAFSSISVGFQKRLLILWNIWWNQIMLLKYYMFKYFNVLNSSKIWELNIEYFNKNHYYILHIYFLSSKNW